LITAWAAALRLELKVGTMDSAEAALGVAEGAKTATNNTGRRLWRTRPPRNAFTVLLDSMCLI
jgi:hypothetical protein